MKKTIFDYIRKDYDYKEIKQALKDGMDVNARMKGTYKTPLMVVAENQMNNLIELFVEFGADIDAKSGADKTAILIASERKNTKGVKILLDLGANPTIKDKNGNLPSRFSKGKSLKKAESEWVGKQKRKDLGVFADLME